MAQMLYTLDEPDIRNDGYLPNQSWPSHTRTCLSEGEELCRVARSATRACQENTSIQLPQDVDHVAVISVSGPSTTLTRHPYMVGT